VGEKLAIISKAYLSLLSFTIIEGRIKIENNGGTLKDRFSAVSYANLIANELERNNRAFQNEYEFQTFIN